MGKAADNERLRLRAMFFNTLAAACVITGLFVPYFVMLTAWGRMVATFEFLVTGDWVRLQGWVNGGPVCHRSGPPAWFSIPVRTADKIARSIQD